MKHAVASDRDVAHIARAVIVLALCAGSACISTGNGTPGQPNGGATDQGGAGTGGRDGIGGTPSNASGGSATGAGGGAGGAAGSLGGDGGSSKGGSTSAGSGGVPNSSGGQSGGAAGSPGGSGGNSAGGSTSTGSGGSEGRAGVSGGSGGNGTGGATSTGNGGSGGFDPCPATGNCKILPLGDSITAGAGAQPGDNGGYRVELFTKAVNDSKHITFVGSLSSGPSTVAGVAFPKNHEGHIGWKIDQVSGIATTSQALKDVPQIVLLFIGTNDEGYASSEAGASDRLGQLIDKVVAALPNSLLVVSSIYPFPGCKDTNYTPTQCATNVSTYDAAIPGVIQQRVAQGKHVLFVDMSTPPTDALSTDGVHPNDTVGYPWMGDNWYAVIKSYLH